MTDTPKRNVQQLEEIVKTQKELIEGLQGTHQNYEELLKAKDDHQTSSEKVIESQKAMIEGLEAELRTGNELIAIQKDQFKNAEARMLALEQTALWSTAMQQTADYYAVECRSILVYVLERNEKSRDFLRLWEVLPQDQKAVYNQESAAWIGKQPPKVDPELQAKLKPAPGRER